MKRKNNLEINSFANFKFPFTPGPEFEKPVAYFSMEFAIDQSFRIYSGGLGFLAGSHMRSAFELKQNLIGIGILWKFGYYDQTRNGNRHMHVRYMERLYNFLEDTGIRFTISVKNHPVRVKAMYLAPEVFGTAPMFFLSTDLPENDHLAQTICHHLYDPVPNARIAQSILLGVGGAKLLEEINFKPEIYHLNEAHAIPAAFYIWNREKDLKKVKKSLVLTTHTPDPAGNAKHEFELLSEMGFFCNVDRKQVIEACGVENGIFNHTLAGLKLSQVANGVSKMHGKVARAMWEDNEGICPIFHITNSQNQKYWADAELNRSMSSGHKEDYILRKRQLKKDLFKEVADQTGKIFSPDVFTLVWARRLAPYKRADLITKDLEEFENLVKNKDLPIQIIWAGKPYPKDEKAISLFNYLCDLSDKYDNCAVLTGYELELSKILKQGSDGWLNTPRVTREASGTSGMTAAMNGSVNISTMDGWIPEFAISGKNSFIVPPPIDPISQQEEDEQDRKAFLNLLRRDILPMYYKKPNKWLSVVFNSMKDIYPFFDSDRMATEYYNKLYAYHGESILAGQ